MHQLITNNVLDTLHSALRYDKAVANREILWCFSNIACHSPEVCVVLVNNAVFDVIVKTMKISNDLQTRKETYYVVGNVFNTLHPKDAMQLITQSDDLLTAYLKGL